jgi:hypothetical protein
MSQDLPRLHKMERWHAAHGMAQDWARIRCRWAQQKARLCKELESWEATHPLLPGEEDQRSLGTRSLAERWSRQLGLSSRVLKTALHRRVKGHRNA